MSDPVLRPLPPLYPITDSSSLRSLSAQIARLGEAGFPLVQFRGKPLEAKAQWEELHLALLAAQANGGWPLICVNDRADLAVLAAAEGLSPWGLHLGQSDLAAEEAAGLPGLRGLRLGASTHSDLEWREVNGPVDHAGVGPFRCTNTKPDHAEPIGLAGLTAGCAALRAKGIAPIAIGGLRLEDAAPCFTAGAESLAMIGELTRSSELAELGWLVQRARHQARPFDLTRGVVLTGSSGAGKSSLGSGLAQRLGLPFHDLDQVVEQGEGASIPQLFSSAGEAAFRQMEVHHLQPLLGAPAVIALGGGAWETAAVRDQVGRSGFQTLWLAEPPARCWERVASDPQRPLAQDREAFMARHRARLLAWADLPLVASFGRSSVELAELLAP